MTDYNENLMEITPDVNGGGARTSSIIKVIGVGGGGSNAVRHMYNMGITDVDFIICNTDKQALGSNPIPLKIQLGESGLGAGAIPEVARQAALESEKEIKAALEGTKMVFITAGMGGGTGTGASPIVASIAKELDILTVGIVTYPFRFEQKEKADIADEGIEELSQNVDALIVIKNEALKSFYPDLLLSNAFAKVDDVLLIAAKSIAEIITKKAVINVDFNDVKTILKNSGTALIGSGEAEGEDRAVQAVDAAISSPLLDQNSIYGTEKLLFFISYGTNNELTINELDKITDEIERKTCTESKKLIWGHGPDDSLGDKVRVTVIATGLSNQSSKSKQGKEQQTIPYDTAPPTVDNTPKEEPQTIQRTNLFSSIPNNNELRKKSEEEITEYLTIPAYQREREFKQHHAEHNVNELSRYRAGINGLECRPALLDNVVD
ncbi:MAG: cell division protein FtsZ [Bacteroidales bacterium]|jgi:cell division protein FtsZ|nr:cell division protein FtsZ [Bacteroidales bacterium]